MSSYCLRVVVDDVIAALFAVGELCALEVFLYCYCQSFDIMTCRCVIGYSATTALGNMKDWDPKIRTENRTNMIFQKQLPEIALASHASRIPGWNFSFFFRFRLTRFTLIFWIPQNSDSCPRTFSSRPQILSLASRMRLEKNTG